MIEFRTHRFGGAHPRTDRTRARRTRAVALLLGVFVAGYLLGSSRGPVIEVNAATLPRLDATLEATIQSTRNGIILVRDVAMALGLFRIAL